MKEWFNRLYIKIFPSKCVHDYKQYDLTFIAGGYPKELRYKCEKCGDIVWKKNKYMFCCRREKRINETCKFCGRV